MNDFVDHLLQDLRFGVRFQFKQPGALVASIAALSLGIGLVVFGYCLMQGLFFRLLPFPEPERLVYTSIPGPAYREFNEQQTAFDGLAAFSEQGITLKAAGTSSGRWGFFVTANFFDVLRVKPLDRDVSGYVLAARFLVICGTASLFLAALGIYGLITLAVNQRTREIGIRLALGATRERVMATVLKPALRQIVMGLGAGMLLGFVVVFLIGTIVPLPTHQPWVYLAVCALLGGVGLLAVLLPARRGSRLDPMVALRHE